MNLNLDSYLNNKTRISLAKVLPCWRNQAAKVKGNFIPMLLNTKRFKEVMEDSELMDIIENSPISKVNSYYGSFRDDFYAPENGLHNLIPFFKEIKDDKEEFVSDIVSRSEYNYQPYIMLRAFSLMIEDGYKDYITNNFFDTEYGKTFRSLYDLRNIEHEAMAHNLAALCELNMDGLGFIDSNSISNTEILCDEKFPAIVSIVRFLKAPVCYKTVRQFVNMDENVIARFYSNEKNVFSKYFFSVDMSIYQNNCLSIFNFAEKATDEEYNAFIKKVEENSLYFWKIVLHNDGIFESIFEKYSTYGLFNINDILTFLNWATANKKKNLLRTFVQFEASLKTLSYIFSPEFCSIVDLNSASYKDVHDIIYKKEDGNMVEDYDAVRKFYNSVVDNFKGHTYTIVEIKFLINATPFQKMVYPILDLPIDKKIRITRELPDLNIEKVKEFIPEFVKYLSVRSFSNMEQELKKKVKMVLPEHVVMYYANEEKLSPYMKSGAIQIGADIAFIVKNENVPSNRNEYLLFKRYLIYGDSDFKTFLSYTKFDDKFVQKYLDNLFEFSSRGLIQICNHIFGDSTFKFEQRNNFSLIVKAEIAGKMKMLKYNPSDYEKEIGCAVSDKERAVWENDGTITNGNIFATDIADFEKILRIGEFPCYTCQNHTTGAYRESLLSNYDTNKKLITVYQNGQYVTRALFRFTQYQEEKISQNTSLTFRDVEDDENETTSTSENKPIEVKKCLLLELPYSTANDNSKIYATMIELALAKAREMGVSLIVNPRYFNYEAVKEKFNGQYEKKSEIYVFISRSKNGYQYLDSLSGEVTINSEGQFKCGNNLYLFK